MEEVRWFNYWSSYIHVLLKLFLGHMMGGGLVAACGLGWLFEDNTAFENADRTKTKYNKKPFMSSRQFCQRCLMQ